MGDCCATSRYPRRSLYGHVRRPRRPGPNMVFVVPVAGSATGTAGTTGHADDSALRECHESRGTRYSERHSAHYDAAAPALTWLSSVSRSSRKRGLGIGCVGSGTRLVPRVGVGL